MTVEELPHADPATLSPLLRVLLHDANGDWESAHNEAQDVETADGAWVHAYLHRKEGDRSNADYWYRRAGRSCASGDLRAEWLQIAGELLER